MIVLHCGLPFRIWNVCGMFVCCSSGADLAWSQTAHEVCVSDMDNSWNVPMAFIPKDRRNRRDAVLEPLGGSQVPPIPVVFPNWNHHITLYLFSWHFFYPKQLKIRVFNQVETTHQPRIMHQLRQIRWTASSATFRKKRWRKIIFFWFSFTDFVWSYSMSAGISGVPVKQFDHRSVRRKQIVKTSRWHLSACLLRMSENFLAFCIQPKPVSLLEVDITARIRNAGETVQWHQQRTVGRLDSSTVRVHAGWDGWNCW